MILTLKKTLNLSYLLLRYIKTLQYLQCYHFLMGILFFLSHYKFAFRQNLGEISLGCEQKKCFDFEIVQFLPSGIKEKGTWILPKVLYVAG